MSEITTVGLDLAKRVVSLRGEVASGRVVVQRSAVRVVRLRVVGALTASALSATVVDPGQFRCGRQFAAGLGKTITSSMKELMPESRRDGRTA